MGLAELLWFMLLYASAVSCISLMCCQLASLQLPFKPSVGAFGYGRVSLFKKDTNCLQFPKAFLLNAAGQNKARMVHSCWGLGAGEITLLLYLAGRLLILSEFVFRFHTAP